MKLALTARTRRILTFITPYWKQLSAVLALMILGTALDLTFPAILGKAIDILNNQPGDADQVLLLLVGALVLLSLVRIVVGGVHGYAQAWVASHVTFDMRNDLYTHLQILPMRFYARTRTGDIMSRLNGDITEIQSVATGALVGFITSVLTLIGTTAMLVYYNWKLFLLSCLITPFAAAVLSLFRNRIHRVALDVRERNAELADFTVESLSGMRFVRALGAERFEFAKYRDAGRRLIQTLLRYQVVSTFGGGLPGSLLVLGAAIALFIGGRMVLDGSWTIGGLTAFAIYQARLFGPLQGLMGLYMRIQRARASVDRVFEYLDLAPEAPDLPDAVSPGTLEGRVEFERVTFGYEEDRPVLDDVSFTIEPGERVALVGPSGVGKSTIVDLLWRFYTPTSGRIRVDGRDLRTLRHRELIEQMAVVGQDPFLFNASLRDNIRYGWVEATDGEIGAALAAADLDGFGRSLPHGLDTEVGERGVQVSTGQRQRIALARAFLRKPKILVLDEATSSLDWISEEAVRRSMEALMLGTTTLIITHRLARARHADRILVLDQGRIVERGTHAELARAGGLYARLVQHEAGREAALPVPDPELLARLGRGPQLPGTGQGVRVAVVDSGVNAPHPHVARTAGGITITSAGGDLELQPGFEDRHGHGTATAALLSYLAPDIELVAIKIFDRELRTTQEHLRAAIAWALDRGCRIINLSLGTPAGAHVEALHAVCREAASRGAIIVAAAPEGDTSFPSAFEEVIAVGEDRSLGDDEIRISGSAHAEFLASGYARPQRGVHPEANFKGASFAAARVSSLLARLIELDPGADAARLRAKLKQLCSSPDGARPPLERST